MLTKLQMKILKCLYDGPCTAADIATTFIDGVKPFSDEWSEVVTSELEGLIYFSNGVGPDTVMRLKSQGQAIVEVHVSNGLRFWLPIIISNLIAFAAMIISIISLVL